MLYAVLCKFHRLQVQLDRLTDIPKRFVPGVPFRSRSQAERDGRGETAFLAGLQNDL